VSVLDELRKIFTKQEAEIEITPAFLWERFCKDLDFQNLVLANICKVYYEYGYNQGMQIAEHEPIVSEVVLQLMETSVLPSSWKKYCEVVLQASKEVDEEDKGIELAKKCASKLPPHKRKEN
jgi:hypothetical protein